MARIKFDITKYLISKGTKLVATAGTELTEVCPTALSIKKVFGKNTDISVNGTEAIFVIEDFDTFAFTLPSRVQKFIEVFDDSDVPGKPKAQPLTFTLNIPATVLKRLKYTPAK